MKKQLRVVLLIESSRAFGRGLLAGIAAYSMTHGPWTFFHEERSIDDPTPHGLRRWAPDGCIGRIWPTLEGTVRRLGIPTVNVLGESAIPGMPKIAPDDRLISQVAIDHLLNRGLRQFAFCGFRDLVFSELRKKAFCEELDRLGLPVSVFEDGGPVRPIGLVAFEQKWLHQLGRMSTWLRDLPKPVGLMACNDVRAYQVSNACREASLEVPDEVAIVGVDNDPTLCDLATPPLTSIDPNAAKVGYEAAALLHRLIEMNDPPPEEVLIEPTGIVARSFERRAGNSRPRCGRGRPVCSRSRLPRIHSRTSRRPCGRFAKHARPLVRQASWSFGERRDHPRANRASQGIAGDDESGGRRGVAILGILSSGNNVQAVPRSDRSNAERFPASPASDRPRPRVM